MVAVQNSYMHKIILAFAAIAFVRSLAPERTEGLARSILRSRKPQILNPKHSTIQQQLSKEKQQLVDLKDEIQRERLALQKLKDHINTQKDIDSIDMQQQQQTIKSADEITVPIIPDDPDAYSDPQDKNLSTTKIQQKSFHNQTINNIEQSDMESIVLNDGECSTIMVPEFTKAGLGIQIEHLWTSLSLTLAVRNACVVLPPVVADDGNEHFHLVPFYQVFDMDQLSQTGLKFVSLHHCKDYGVPCVFDDSGAESAIVKNFATFVNESHPGLHKETSLVDDNSQGFRFQSDEEIEQNVNKVAEYVQSKLSTNNERYCIGIGRMKAKIGFNNDVIEHFNSAPSILKYISIKFGDLNDMMFVRLRWSGSSCDSTEEQAHMVCILSKMNIVLEDFVDSIVYTSKQWGIKKIYISSPSTIPDKVSRFLIEHLPIQDPVLLDVEGDLFTANVIERELATQSKVFVPDGGAWGESVQHSRRVLHGDAYMEGFDTLRMIDKWKEADSPRERSQMESGNRKR